LTGCKNDKSGQEQEERAFHDRERVAKRRLAREEIPYTIESVRIWRRSAFIGAKVTLGRPKHSLCRVGLALC
jgi:hypothetical protein